MDDSPGDDPVEVAARVRAAAAALAAVDVDLRDPDAADAVVDLLGHVHGLLAARAGDRRPAGRRA